MVLLLRAGRKPWSHTSCTFIPSSVCVLHGSGPAPPTLPPLRKGEKGLVPPIARGDEQRLVMNNFSHAFTNAHPAHARSRPAHAVPATRRCLALRETDPGWRSLMRIDHGNHGARAGRLADGVRRPRRTERSFPRPGRRPATWTARHGIDRVGNLRPGISPALRRRGSSRHVHLLPPTRRIRAYPSTFVGNRWDPPTQRRSTAPVSNTAGGPRS